MRFAKWIAPLLLVTSLTLSAQRTYFGFDKDDYPGDDLLPKLHRTFAFTGYWLNHPPGMRNNPWTGKRGVVRAAGLGFLILFDGRLDAQLRNQNAAEPGRADAAAAIAAAGREGFPAGAVIFLDQEEGGSLLPEQVAYIGAWIAGLGHSRYKPGLYCSGIAVPSGPKMISTAEDVESRFAGVKLWVWNDRCPPAPGCIVADRGFDPAQSGFSQALVWQYAQSPRRPENTAACQRTYAQDGMCYVPRLPHSRQTYVDLNISRLPDPSRGR
jgi:hypothetical protein